MPPIINAQQISKTYGIAPLFHNISFTVSEGDRIGLIGPNGIGKSTLLKILANRLAPDSGDVAVRKRTRLSYVAQQSEFDATQTVQSVVEAAMDRTGVAESERQSLMAETLGRAALRTSRPKRRAYQEDGESDPRLCPAKSSSSTSRAVFKIGLKSR